MTEQATVLSADDRGVALDLAVRMFTGGRYTGDTERIIETAQKFFSWLDGSADRATALELAVRMFTAGRYSGGPHEVIKIAEVFTGFLTGPVPAKMQFAITLEGDPQMPITVDSANAVAILSFTDDHGDAVPAPDGTLATATSDNPAVLTVGAGGRRRRRERRREHPVPAVRSRRGCREPVGGRHRRERQPAARPGRGDTHPGRGPGCGDGQPRGGGRRGVHRPRQLTAASPVDTR